MAEPKAYKAKLSDFKPDQHNLNRHKQRGRGMVETSQRKRGFGRPGFAAKDKTMLGGNLSILEVAADIELGNGEIFVVETDGDIPIVHVRRDLDPDTEAAKLLAAEDNKSALESIDFDPEMFAAEIAAGIDFGGIFTADEQAAMLAGLNDEPPEDTGPQIDRAEELRQEWGVELGQLWALGEHRLICGDCTDKEVVEKVMGGERADCLIGDPPYGMNLDTSYSNSVDNPKKNIKASRGYNRVIGDNEPFDPSPLFELFAEIPEQFYWGADYYRGKLPDGGSWLVWDKRTSVEDVQYSSSEFELCWSKKPHHRFILRVPWFGIIGTEQQDTQMRLHPTQKPLGVITPIMEKYGGNIILDPFLGSGTTMVVAHKLGKRCFGVELDPGYVAVTLERFQTTFGIEPELID